MAKKLKTPKRPFRTYYYDEVDAPYDAYVTQGNCKSEDGAKRASIVRVYMREHPKALIINTRTWIVLWTLKRTDKGVEEYIGNVDNPAVERSRALGRIRRVK